MLPKYDIKIFAVIFGIALYLNHLFLHYHMSLDSYYIYIFPHGNVLQSDALGRPLIALFAHLLNILHIDMITNQSYFTL